MAPFLIVAAGIWVYHNSFSVPFLMDDLPRIVENPSIHPGQPFRTLITHWYRPTVSLSLAFNYALGGLNVWGYHAFNLAVHLGAALALFGILCRTLERPIFQGRYRQASVWLAFWASLLWMVHPLQTQSVTYLIQRSESMMGLFYLATLYGLIRSADSPQAKRWQTASIAACILGTGSKAIIATAPLAALWYDRLFLASSWKQLWRRRKFFYLGLAATWLALAGVLIFLTGDDIQNAGFGLERLTPKTYVMSQPGIVLHYLRLAFWPDPLCFDYVWPLVRRWDEVLLPTLAVGAVAASVLWLLWRRRPIGFLGVWFFGILAPSSSFIPVADLAQEHRMYLPLAAVTTGVTLGGWYLLGRWIRHAVLRRLLATALAFSVSVGLGWMTLRRNHDYRSALSLWSDTVAKRPNNPRAHNNLGIALEELGKPEEAIWHYTESLRLYPLQDTAHGNLGLAYQRMGRWEEALRHYEVALGYYEQTLPISPRAVKVRVNLGTVLAQLGRLDEARHQFLKALALQPRNVEAHLNLGLLWEKRGESVRAQRHYERALRETLPPQHPLHPDSAEGRQWIRTLIKNRALWTNGRRVEDDTIVAR